LSGLTSPFFCPRRMRLSLFFPPCFLQPRIKVRLARFEIGLDLRRVIHLFLFLLDLFFLHGFPISPQVLLNCHPAEPVLCKLSAFPWRKKFPFSPPPAMFFAYAQIHFGSPPEFVFSLCFFFLFLISPKFRCRLPTQTGLRKARPLSLLVGRPAPPCHLEGFVESVTGKEVVHGFLFFLSSREICPPRFHITL